MKTKIKYNELKEISDFIISKSDEIVLEYQEIDKIIDSVSNAWNGKDSKEFIEEAKKTVSEEKAKVDNLKKFGDNLAIISNDYVQLENNFLEKMKKESLDNG